jgi:hypothetical protein
MVAESITVTGSGLFPRKRANFEPVTTTSLAVVVRAGVWATSWADKKMRRRKKNIFAGNIR